MVTVGTILENATNKSFYYESVRSASATWTGIIVDVINSACMSKRLL